MPSWPRLVLNSALALDVGISAQSISNLYARRLRILGPWDDMPHVQVEWLLLPVLHCIPLLM